MPSLLEHGEGRLLVRSCEEFPASVHAARRGTNTLRSVGLVALMLPITPLIFADAALAQGNGQATVVTGTGDEAYNVDRGNSPDVRRDEKPGEAGDDETLSETPVRPARVGTDQENLPHWVDSSHAYATNRAQALAQWMDDFFGAQVRDAERADTFVRAIAIDDWDDRDGHDFRFRLRGQLSLPKISERVDLIFSGEEAEQTLTEDERAQESDVGVRFNFRDSRRFRVDATMSLRAGPALLPGVRLRYQKPLSERSWARMTQRLQYHSSDGYRALTNLDLNRAIGRDRMLRLGARLRYREEKAFWDWNTGIFYRKWLSDHDDFPSALQYYVAVSGRHSPEPFNTNYRVGMVYRKQFFRKFLFYEVEPSYNWRRDTFEEDREGVLGIVLRLEIMLDDDLITQ